MLLIMNDELTTSTELGIGKDLLNKIQDTNFCIVGCGGVGAFFAEMLIRTGATKITLIDADNVELKNLNRTPFVSSDVGDPKVKVLKKRLESINSEIKIKAIDRHFGHYLANDSDRQEVRNSVIYSDTTLIAVDENNMRIECEKLLNDFNNEYLVIGVKINKNVSEYACGWMTMTQNFEKDLSGYGENNGSYMSIVMAAVSAGFDLMLHNMKAGDFERSKYTKREYINYFPVDKKPRTVNFSVLR